MLQICTGKLFEREYEYKNLLKGIIYTNLKFNRENKIVTEAGSIESTEDRNSCNTVIYEVIELIESQADGQKGFLISNRIDSYIMDFSSILSFAVNCIATPSYSLTERLLSNQIGVSTHDNPKKIIKQIFDENIYLSENDEKFLIEFINQLIGLDRKTYLGVINSIRTYVTGIHRIADDFELAYTLLVASVESLAQKFDGHQSEWIDYDNNKRDKIDCALEGAEDLIIEKVRNAILSIEHISLGKRYRVFCLNHLKPSFFRNEAASSVNPISKGDLNKALSKAYQARSQYIHNLTKLPKRLTIGGIYLETFTIDGEVWLTLQGLSRLSRHVIIEFIMKQQTIKKETYPYLLEQSNVMQVEWSPEYWIGDIDFAKGSGLRKLEAFLNQLANCLGKIPNSSCTDISALLNELDKNISNLTKADRIAYLTLYLLFKLYVNSENKLTNFEKIKPYINTHLTAPNSFTLIAYHLSDQIKEWDLKTHNDVVSQYFKEREHKDKLRISKFFESTILLELAERFRKAFDNETAKLTISMAVENDPSNSALRQFEIDFIIESREIDYSRILIGESD